MLFDFVRAAFAGPRTACTDLSRRLRDGVSLPTLTRSRSVGPHAGFLIVLSPLCVRCAQRCHHTELAAPGSPEAPATDPGCSAKLASRLSVSKESSTRLS